MTLKSGLGREALTASYRWTSLFEVAVGVFLVLGHNVFRVVPNEVFFLFALFWVSFKVRDGGWRVAGLKRPSSWRRTLVLALVDLRWKRDELRWQAHALSLLVLIRAVVFNLHLDATWHGLSVRLLSLSLVAAVPLHAQTAADSAGTGDCVPATASCASRKSPATFSACIMAARRSAKAAKSQSFAVGAAARIAESDAPISNALNFTQGNWLAISMTLRSHDHVNQM